MGRSKNPRLEEAILRYQRGEDTARIGRDLCVAGETVRQWLIERGIPRRSISERNRIYDYDHKAFSISTPISAYWAGLLMADGSISKHGLISLELQDRDAYLVYGLKAFMNYSGPITKRTRYQKSGNKSRMKSLFNTVRDSQIAKMKEKEDGKTQETADPNRLEESNSGKS